MHGEACTGRVAEHIASLNIDPLLREGDPQAVPLVARVRMGAKVRNYYSFATKYCAWHNPEAYPIYEDFVNKMLWGYRKQDGFADFLRQDLWDYVRFKEIIGRFRRFYGLTAVDLKDIDKFLWLAGKEFIPITYPVAEKVAAVEDAGYLQGRAERGDVDAALKVLEKAGDQEASAEDRIQGPSSSGTEVS